MKSGFLIPALLLSLLATETLAASGKDVYTKTCSVCHATGIAGAPKYGNAGDWSPRLANGVAQAYANALKGTARGMPAKGGNPSLPDADVKAAVDYMVAAVRGAAPDAKEAPKPAAKAPAKEAAKSAEVAKAPAKSEPPAAKADAKAEPSAAPPPAVAAPPAPAIVAGGVTSGVSAADANAFNRLLKPVGKRNPPPTDDDIHDPGNDGTHALLPPLTAYGTLPKSMAGNRVNWVQAIEQQKINPRWDRLDEKAQAMVMDMNIVREVKGSMPDVVYPHKQHTEWLDCSNCHPAIFVPQKGANSISMAAILLGEKCGVCHGKVAFPVSECRLCHSKKKDPVTRTTTTANTK